MEWYKILILVVAILIVLFLGAAYLTHRVAFGRRSDRTPCIKYFTAEDFGLTAEEVREGRLRGFIYTKKDVEKRNATVVFVHGMGPGQVAYTTEIAYFCKLGYTVIALDSLGCGFSGGREMRGMYENVKAAKKAVAISHTRLPENKVYLVGHSWGAYSALCASAQVKVDGVVAISAPLTPVKTVCYGAKPMIGILSFIISPFWAIVNFLYFGVHGNDNAAKCAKKSGVKTLVIHGDSDGVVSGKNAAYSRVNGENITKYCAKNKAHNPYNTVAAERRLSELTERLRKSIKDFSDFDFTAATEEDEEVMRVIADFLV